MHKTLITFLTITAFFVVKPVLAADILLTNSNDVVIYGPIIDGDVKRFERALATLSSQPEISLASPGGEVLEAIKLGRLIRRLGLETSAPYDLRSSVRCWRGNIGETDPGKGDRPKGEAKDCYCASACFLTWLGGVRKEGDMLAIHRASRKTKDGSKITLGDYSSFYRANQTIIRDYLLEMGNDDDLLRLMNETPSNKLSILPDKIIKELSASTPVAFEEWIAEKCGSGISKPEREMWYYLNEKERALNKKKRTGNTLSDAEVAIQQLLYSKVLCPNRAVEKNFQSWAQEARKRHAVPYYKVVSQHVTNRELEEEYKAKEVEEEYFYEKLRALKTPIKILSYIPLLKDYASFFEPMRVFPTDTKLKAKLRTLGNKEITLRQKLVGNPNDGDIWFELMELHGNAGHYSNYWSNGPFSTLPNTIDSHMDSLVFTDAERLQSAFESIEFSLEYAENIEVFKAELLKAGKLAERHLDIEPLRLKTVFYTLYAQSIKGNSIEGVITFPLDDLITEEMRLKEIFRDIPLPISKGFSRSEQYHLISSSFEDLAEAYPKAALPLIGKFIKAKYSKKRIFTKEENLSFLSFADRLPDGHRAKKDVIEAVEKMRSSAN